MTICVTCEDKFRTFITFFRILLLPLPRILVTVNHLVIIGVILREDILIAELHAGSNKAFRSLFRLYYHPLCAYAYRCVQDDTMTDDFVQDAFMSFWNHRNEFQALASVRSFLYINVRNACLNWLKHLSVRQRNEIGLVSFLQDDEDNIILEDAVHAKLYAAINKLSDRAHEVVLMALGGESNAEIAESLGISQNTVKTIKWRAYNVLRKELSEYKLLLALLLTV